MDVCVCVSFRFVSFLYSLLVFIMCSMLMLTLGWLETQFIIQQSTCTTNFFSFCVSDADNSDRANKPTDRDNNNNKQIEKWNWNEMICSERLLRTATIISKAYFQKCRSIVRSRVSNWKVELFTGKLYATEPIVIDPRWFCWRRFVCIRRSTASSDCFI